LRVVEFFFRALFDCRFNQFRVKTFNLDLAS
jgi:hypothetical protein